MWFLKLLIVYSVAVDVQCSDCSVFLTVSTKSLSYYDSNLVINWGPECENPPIVVELFDYNPYVVKSPALFTGFTGSLKSGKIETDTKLKELTLPYRWDKHAKIEQFLEPDNQKCLDFYIVSYNQTGHATNFDCLKIQPQWMTEMKEIWKLPLKQLYIPATHCSGCYMTRDNAKNKNLRFTQNFDIWHQLVLGVRHFDFSIELFDKIGHLFYDPDGPFYEKLFWVKNGDRMISPLFPILRDVVKFIERSQEIVILSFSSFSEEFADNPEVHEVFKQLLSDEFGKFAFVNQQNGRDSFDLTIDEMKSLSKYLLITYHHQNLSFLNSNASTIFWPSWQRSLLSKNADMDVVQYMKNVFSEKFRSDTKNGWILSLDAENIRTDNKTNLREKIEIINSKALYPLGGPWSLKANVVSLDFAFSTNFIDVAVYTNQQKGAAFGNFTVIDLS